MNSTDNDESVVPHSLGGCALSQSKRTIQPDQAPYHDESVVPYPPVKNRGQEDLEFLQRCFRDALCGELENWPAETFQLYRATLSRLHDLLESATPTYGECIARMAILELSRKISASAKARNLLHQISSRKH